MIKHKYYAEIGPLAKYYDKMHWHALNLENGQESIFNIRDKRYTPGHQIYCSANLKLQRACMFMHASKIMFFMKTKNNNNPWWEHSFWNLFYWIRNILTSEGNAKHTKFYHQNVTSEGDQGWGITCVHRQNVISYSPWPHTENNLHEKSSHTQNKARSKQKEKVGIMGKSKKCASLPYYGIWWATSATRMEGTTLREGEPASTIHHRSWRGQ
jgi:hypothetical protein